MTYRREVPVLLLSVLFLLAGPRTPVLAQRVGIQLGELPGISPPQASVGTAIDILCPKLASMDKRTGAQQDLLTQCGNMKVGANLGTTSALGNSVLPGVLLDVTSEQTAAQGTSAVETRSTQLRLIGPRLSALRLGSTGIALNGLKLDFDGNTAAADQSTGAERRGGGASADTNLAGPLGVFVNAVGGFGRKDTTADEAGFHFHNVGVTAGADYRFTTNLAAGLALSYLRTNADFNSNLGDADTNTFGISLYGTYYVGGFYVDALTGFSWHHYDTARNIVYGPGPDADPAPNQPPAQPVNRTATSDTDGRQFTIDVGVGYDFRLGATTLTPYTRVEYLNLQIDGYTEQGADGLNLKVRDQSAESLLTVLGGRVAHAVSTPFAVLVPQVRGEWRHEFLNNQRSTKAQFANDPFDTLFTIPTDNPDRDYFALGAAVSAVFQKGVAAFLDFETILGLRSITNYNFTAGVRIQF